MYAHIDDDYGTILRIYKKIWSRWFSAVGLIPVYIHNDDEE